MSYPLSLVTPQGKIFEGAVEALSAPGVAGEFGVLSGHVPIVSALKSGLLKITENRLEKFYAIGAGILEVNKDHGVLILTDAAQSVSNRDEACSLLKSLEKS